MAQECPYCGKHALTFWKRRFMPWGSFSCKSCGGKISYMWKRDIILTVAQVAMLVPLTMLLAWMGMNLIVAVLLAAVVDGFAFHWLGKRVLHLEKAQ